MRREVFNNIIHFKDNLLDLGERGRKNRAHKRVYLTLINRATGDMRFAQKITELEHHLPKNGNNKESYADWQEIHLTVEDEHGMVHFHLNDMEGKHLKPSQFEPTAWTIISETIKALNELAATHQPVSHEVLPERAALSDVHKSLSKEKLEDTPGWVPGKPTRIDAENMLKGKPVGTYLITKGDEMIQAISKRLTETNGITVKAYVLTVIEKENKISDILLIHTQQGWAIFSDDPILDCSVYHYHPTLKSLLETIRHRAKTPL